MKTIRTILIHAVPITALVWAWSASARGITVVATSYNPSVSQSDDSPCTGASGRNLCTAAREGDRVIAVSRNLLWRNGGPFKWHDKLRLVSDIPNCRGVFSVEDTLAPRFTNRVDLFFLDRRDNTSCTGTVEKVTF